MLYYRHLWTSIAISDYWTPEVLVSPILGFTFILCKGLYQSLVTTCNLLILAILATSPLPHPPLLHPGISDHISTPALEHHNMTPDNMEAPWGEG